MKSRLSYEIPIFRRRRSENAMLWWHNKSIFHNKSISKRLLCEWDDGAQGEMSDNRTDNLSGHDSNYRGIRGSHHRQRYLELIQGPESEFVHVVGRMRKFWVMRVEVTTMMTTTSTMGTTSSGFGSTTSQSDKYYQHGNYANFNWDLNFRNFIWGTSNSRGTILLKVVQQLFLV